MGAAAVRGRRKKAGVIFFEIISTIYGQSYLNPTIKKGNAFILLFYLGQ